MFFVFFAQPEAQLAARKEHPRRRGARRVHLSKAAWGGRTHLRRLHHVEDSHEVGGTVAP